MSVSGSRVNKKAKPARRPSANGAQAAPHLTPAEANVLVLLPTHLSLEAIAERLGCKRSTVKTHVTRIYRKVGAKTRAQAVEGARSAGLLSDEAAL